MNLIILFLGIFGLVCVAGGLVILGVVIDKNFNKLINWLKQFFSRFDFDNDRVSIITGVLFLVTDLFLVWLASNGSR